MDTSSTTSSFTPTREQATFRFTTTSPTPPPTSNYQPPSVSDVPEDLPPRARTPPPNTTSTDDDLLRKCRICFETSAPPYHPSPELGRLLSPCVCRGSSRYVHAGCLQQWRDTSRDAFYVCPTCKYPYRLQRLSYASAITSTTTTFFATSCILLAIVWALGFVSGPILSTYLVDVPEDLDLPVARGGWAEHFLRGLASLGLLGFFKVIYLVGPGSWYSLRNSGVLGGRERVNRISWIVIAVGVANFFVWLWKRVGTVVQTRMDMMAGEVLDVGDAGDGAVREEAAEGVPWGTWVAGVAAGAWTGAVELTRWATGRP